MKAKVLIVVKGGLVQYINSNTEDIEISVADFDVSDISPEEGEEPQSLFTYYKSKGDNIFGEDLFESEMQKLQSDWDYKVGLKKVN